MKIDKSIIRWRNRLAELICDLDSCAIIEGSGLTSSERDNLKKKLEIPLKWVDKELKKERKRVERLEKKLEKQKQKREKTKNDKSRKN